MANHSHDGEVHSSNRNNTNNTPEELSTGVETGCISSLGFKIRKTVMGSKTGNRQPAKDKEDTGPKLFELPIHIGIGFWQPHESQARDMMIDDIGYRKPLGCDTGYMYLVHETPGAVPVELFDRGIPGRNQHSPFGWSPGSRKGTFILPSENPKLQAKLLAEIFGFTLKSETVVSKGTTTIEFVRDVAAVKWHIGVHATTLGKAASRLALKRTFATCPSPDVAEIFATLTDTKGDSALIFESGLLPGFSIELLCKIEALRAHRLKERPIGGSAMLASPWTNVPA